MQELHSPLCSAGQGDRPWRQHVIVVLGYVALTVALTYPVAFRLADGLPGDGIDGPLFVWNEWWVRFAIIHRLPIFETHEIFHPEGASLVWHTLSLSNGVLAAPFAALWNPIVVHNLLVVASFVLSGYGTFLVARRESDVGMGGAFLAGVIFAFCPYKMAHLLGHVNLTTTQYLPLFAWSSLRALDARTVRQAAVRGAVTAAFWAANLYTEHTYAFFAGLWLVVLLVSTFVERKLADREGERKLAHPGTWNVRVVVVTVLAFGLGTLLFASPLLAAVVHDARRGEVPAFLNVGALDFSASLRGYLRPSWLHPLLGNHAHSRKIEETVTLGIIATALAIVGGVVQLRRRRIVWVATTVVFVSLSFGPTLRWAERDLGLPMPYTLVMRTPGLRSARAPSRFVAVGALGVAILAASGLTRLTRRTRSLRGRRVGAAAPALATLGVAFEYLVAPFPVSRVPQRKDVFDALARATPKEGTVLEVPLSARDAFVMRGVEDPDHFLAQPEYDRPRLGGMVARMDPRHIASFDAQPFLPTLLRAERDELPSFPNRAEACALLERMKDLSFVLVSPHWRSTMAADLVRRSLPLSLLLDDGEWAAYRIDRDGCDAHFTASGPNFIRSDDPRIRLGSGWYGVEQSPAPAARVWVWSSGRAELELDAKRVRVVRLFGALGTPTLERHGHVRLLVDGAPVLTVEPKDRPIVLEHRFDTPVDRPRLGIEITEPFVPERDRRELGLELDAFGYEVEP